MSWQDVEVDDFGWTGKLTLQQDGTAVDISTYVTKQFILRDPDKVATVKTASFDSDGSDGILKYVIQDGDIDAVGNWSVQARIIKAGVELTSSDITFHVKARLD